VRVEAETIAWESGVRTAQSDQIGMYVTNVANGSYIRVRGVDFGHDGASSFSARVASGSQGGSIELHLDTSDGPTIGSLAVSNTGGWYVWKTQSAPVSNATGVHDLFLVFQGSPTGQLLNLDYWKFNRKGQKQ
jgi:arabinoxylan arabinofuranohydrolase